MELSTVFHSQHAKLPADWPREENMLAWPDLPLLPAAVDSPVLRTKSIIAVGYGYATDKRLARPLIRSCIQYFS